jgi:hypothetical protein
MRWVSEATKMTFENAVRFINRVQIVLEYGSPEQQNAMIAFKK